MDSAEAVIDEANARGLHVMAAPFVQLSPTIRELWTRPLADPDHDLHVIELLCVASTSARERRAVPVRSRPPRPDLRIDAAGTVRHVHDHTRPPDQQ